MKNYYDILEISQRSSKEVMKNAYQVLVKKYQPDLYKGQDRIYAEQKIKDINEAYKILSDDFLREQYDTELEKEIKNYTNKENIKKDNIKDERYKEKRIKQKVPKENSTEESNFHRVGTFMSLIDLGKDIFRNVPRKRIKDIKKEDLIAAGLTLLIIIVLGIILWFIPATNSFIRSIIPFV